MANSCLPGSHVNPTNRLQSAFNIPSGSNKVVDPSSNDVSEGSVNNQIPSFAAGETVLRNGQRRNYADHVEELDRVSPHRFRTELKYLGANLFRYSVDGVLQFVEKKQPPGTAKLECVVSSWPNWMNNLLCRPLAVPTAWAQKHIVRHPGTENMQVYVVATRRNIENGKTMLFVYFFADLDKARQFCGSAGVAGLGHASDMHLVDGRVCRFRVASAETSGTSSTTSNPINVQRSTASDPSARISRDQERSKSKSFLLFRSYVHNKNGSVQQDRIWRDTPEGLQAAIARGRRAWMSNNESPYRAKRNITLEAINQFFSLSIFSQLKMVVVGNSIPVVGTIQSIPGNQQLLFPHQPGIGQVNSLSQQYRATTCLPDYSQQPANHNHDGVNSAAQSATHRVFNTDYMTPLRGSTPLASDFRNSDSDQFMVPQKFADYKTMVDETVPRAPFPSGLRTPTQLFHRENINPAAGNDALQKDSRAATEGAGVQRYPDSARSGTLLYVTTPSGVPIIEGRHLRNNCDAGYRTHPVDSVQADARMPASEALPRCSAVLSGTMLNRNMVQPGAGSSHQQVQGHGPSAGTSQEACMTVPSGGPDETNVTQRMLHPNSIGQDRRMTAQPSPGSPNLDQTASSWRVERCDPRRKYRTNRRSLPLTFRLLRNVTDATRKETSVSYNDSQDIPNVTDASRSAASASDNSFQNIRDATDATNTPTFALDNGIQEEPLDLRVNKQSV